jgi:hypothetical protein
VTLPVRRRVFAALSGTSRRVISAAMTPPQFDAGVSDALCSQVGVLFLKLDSGPWLDGTISRTSRSADLFVVGRHGDDGFPGLCGTLLLSGPGRGTRFGDRQGERQGIERHVPGAVLLFDSGPSRIV